MLGSLLGGVGGAIGNIAVLAGAAGKGGLGEYKQIPDLWRKLKESDFDFRSLSAPELQVLAQYSPELYQAVVPREFQQVQDSPGLRQTQMGALDRLQQASTGDLPILERQAQQQAQRGILGSYKTAQEDALQQLAQRGRLGAGDEIQARLAAGSQAQNLAADMGSQIAGDNANRRLGLQQTVGQMAGGLRGQDFQNRLANAEITNRFNELAAGYQNQAAQYNAGARERAQGAREGLKQNVADTNVMNRYGTTLENLNRQNALRDQLFGQQVTKTQGLSGALGQLGWAKDAEKAAKAQAIRGIGQGLGQTAGGLGGLGLGI